MATDPRPGIGQQGMAQAYLAVGLGSSVISCGTVGSIPNFRL